MCDGRLTNAPCDTHTDHWVHTHADCRRCDDAAAIGWHARFHVLLCASNGHCRQKVVQHWTSIAAQTTVPWHNTATTCLQLPELAPHTQPRHTHPTALPLRLTGFSIATSVGALPTPHQQHAYERAERRGKRWRMARDCGGTCRGPALTRLVWPDVRLHTQPHLRGCVRAICWWRSDGGLGNTRACRARDGVVDGDGGELSWRGRRISSSSSSSGSSPSSGSSSTGGTARRRGCG